MPPKRRTPARSNIPTGTGADTLVSRPKALVFISHDSRDAVIAEAFANLLTDVSAGTLKSFRSSDKKGVSGIAFGQEWYSAIMSKLSDATDVVALLTPTSIDRPWILYEAGVAKGRLNTTVFGLAVGVPLETVTTGPFGQFQNCGSDEDSLTRLMLQLLGRNPEAAPREETIRSHVRGFSERVSGLARTNSVMTAGTSPPGSEPAALFEEVKFMIGELKDRLNRALEEPDRLLYAERRDELVAEVPRILRPLVLQLKREISDTGLPIFISRRFVSSGRRDKIVQTVRNVLQEQGCVPLEAIPERGEFSPSLMQVSAKMWVARAGIVLIAGPVEQAFSMNLAHETGFLQGQGKPVLIMLEEGSERGIEGWTNAYGIVAPRFPADEHAFDRSHHGSLNAIVERWISIIKKVE